MKHLFWKKQAPVNSQRTSAHRSPAFKTRQAHTAAGSAMRFIRNFSASLF
jgi:hypothetical protein